MGEIVKLNFILGQIVKHRFLGFRGVIFDIDPEFNNTEEWYQNIPKDIRPHKKQPFYHLFAENEEIYYIAYVSQQNLLPDNSKLPVRHPEVKKKFGNFNGKRYELLKKTIN